MAVAVIQARMGSSRLPGKVLRPLGARSVLAWVVRAARASGEIDEVVVATSTRPGDDVVAEEAATLGCRVARGPEDDVLGRFLIALASCPDETTVVRLTADCPLLDPAVIGFAVRAFASAPLDYLSTTLTRTLPRGLDVEVTSAGALRALDALAVGTERVHVTPHFYLHPEQHSIAGLSFAPPADDLRVTLDEPDDAAVIEALVDLLGDEPPAWRDLVATLRLRDDLVARNAAVRQKEIDEG